MLLYRVYDIIQKEREREREREREKQEISL